MLQVKASPNLQRKRRKKKQKRLRKNLIHYIEKQKKQKPDNTPIAAKFTLKEKTKYEHFRRKTKEINFNKAKDKKKNAKKISNTASKCAQ